MLLEAVIPLPSFKSRWKEAMVGLLVFCCCGLNCPHCLLLVPSAGTAP